MKNGNRNTSYEGREIIQKMFRRRGVGKRLEFRMSLGILVSINFQDGNRGQNIDVLYNLADTKSKLDKTTVYLNLKEPFRLLASDTFLR